MVGEDSQVRVIGEYEVFGGEGAVHFVKAYRLAAIMDVNHDGVDEVGLHWTSFESGGAILFELDQSGGQLDEVLEARCSV